MNPPSVLCVLVLFGAGTLPAQLSISNDPVAPGAGQPGVAPLSGGILGLPTATGPALPAGTAPVPTIDTLFGGAMPGPGLPQGNASLLGGSMTVPSPTGAAVQGGASSLLGGPIMGSPLGGAPSTSPASPLGAAPITGLPATGAGNAGPAVTRGAPATAEDAERMQRASAAARIVQQHIDAAQWQEALNAAGNAMRLAETDYGVQSLAVARRRMDIALILRLAGNAQEAMTWGEKAVGLEQIVGDKQSIDYAMNVQSLGEIYLEVSQTVAAINAFTQSYDVLQSKLPESDPRLLTAVHNLGVAFLQAGQPEAKDYFQRALAGREKIGPPDSVQIAMTTWMLGRALMKEKKYDEAETLVRRALAIYRKHEQAQKAMIMRTLDDLTVLLLASGQLARAEVALRENEETTARLFGEKDTLTLNLLQRRGEYHVARGELLEAEQSYLRAVELHTKESGISSSAAVGANLLVVNFYLQTGAVEKAEKHYLHVLRTVESAIGPATPLAVQLHGEIGDFYYKTMNDLVRAESFYRRALTSAAQGKLTPAPSMRVELARVCTNLGRKNDAIRLFEELLHDSLESGEKGAVMRDIARISLAELRGDASYLNEVIKTNETALKKLKDDKVPASNSDETTAMISVTLAEPCLTTKHPDEAEKQCRRGLDACQRYFSPTHDVPRRTLKCLIWSLHDQKRDNEVMPLVDQYMKLERQRMETMLSFGSAAERLRWLRTQFSLELPVSLGLARETASLLLHSKGVTFDLMLAEPREAEAIKTEEGRALWEQLVELRARMLKETDEPKPSADFEEVRQRHSQLSAKLAQLAGVRDTLQDILQSTVAQVQERIPQDAALLDFFAIPVRERGGKWVSRYGAVLLRRGQEPKLFISQHTRSQVDEMAGYFRASMQQTGSAKKKDEALDALHHAFYEMVLEPLEGELADVKRLYICPDGTLQFVPFATLLDRKNRFLAERFDIRQLTSARDLLRDRPAAAPGANRSINIFASAAYKLGGTPADSRQASAEETSRVVEFVSDRNARQVAPAAGSPQELDLVTKQAATAGWTPQVFRGDQATEQKLRASAAPQCLHVSTHGYFLTTAFEADAARLIRQRSVDTVRPDHSGLLEPSLVRAGVMLAGAEDSVSLWRRGSTLPQDRDGVLSAQEIAGLGLGGTQLVMLSSCDSGAGSGIVSSGVMSAPAAFLFAGAQRVISTLWPASDDATAEFVAAFYERFFTTGDPCIAFHETQRDWLVRVRKSKGLWEAVRQAGAFTVHSNGAEN